LALERSWEILELVPKTPETAWLHTEAEAAREQNARNRKTIEEWSSQTPRGPWPRDDYSRVRQFPQTLATSLRSGMSDLPLEVAGVRLSTGNVSLNTAVAVGCDAMKLAAKLHGWCEVHCWVEGKDRAWLADVIEQGLDIGIFRRGIWYVDRPLNANEAISDAPDKQWSSQGWEAVQAFLRGRDDCPVVTSYSVTDSFPNASIADWEPPPMPDGWKPEWADTPDGIAEWERDHPDADSRLEYYSGYASDLWYDLEWEDQWEMSLKALRERRPWGRLSPVSLGDVYFGPAVSVYDLFAPDRDDRVKAALTRKHDTGEGE
jgi:hypothetical protein